MNFNLKKPCANCPFRSDLKENYGWLGYDRAHGIAQSLEEGAFPCHKTTKVIDDEDEWAYEDEPVTRIKEQHCYGALVLMKKEGKLERNQMMQIAERFGLLVNKHLIQENLPIVDSFKAFADMHADSRNSYVHRVLRFMKEPERKALINTYFL